MATPQEAALNTLVSKYGRKMPNGEPRVFTQDYGGYCVVGVKIGDKTFTASADNWTNALEKLGEKVAA